MKYKAVFIDVDDTLVVHGFDSMPTPRVSRAIAECKDVGVTVCLATSRPLNVVRYIIESLAITGPCVIGGATQIYDPASRSILAEERIPEQAVGPVLAFARERKLAVGVFDGEKNIGLPQYRIPSDVTRVVGLYFPDIAHESAADTVVQLEKIPDVAVHRMPSWDKSSGWIDVTGASATKLHGIQVVSRILGIATHEIIGIGDGYNDFPLLLACGLKIAMGNAVPELKAIADFVAPTVYEDGVAVVIEKFILSH